MLAAIMHVTLWLELFQDSMPVAKSASLSMTGFLKMTHRYYSTIWTSTNSLENAVLLFAIDC